MYAMSNLGEIEKLCNEIMNSPYLRKQTPAELTQLRVLLDKVNLLVNHSVPPLISEVKQLRSQNRKLTAEIEAQGGPVERVGSHQTAFEAGECEVLWNAKPRFGKTLTTYDALDTGLFLCDPVVFEALRQARQAGDTTLSGGIRRLAARRLMRAVDVGRATWCDIDTLADLEHAEDLFASQPEPEVA